MSFNAYLKKKRVLIRTKGTLVPHWSPLLESSFSFSFSFFFFFCFSFLSCKQHDLTKFILLWPPEDCTRRIDELPRCRNNTASSRGRRRARTAVVVGVWQWRAVSFSVVFKPTLAISLVDLNDFGILMKF